MKDEGGAVALKIDKRTEKSVDDWLLGIYKMTLPCIIRQSPESKEKIGEVAKGDQVPIMEIFYMEDRFKSVRGRTVDGWITLKALKPLVEYVGPLNPDVTVRSHWPRGKYLMLSACIIRKTAEDKEKKGSVRPGDIVNISEVKFMDDRFSSVRGRMRRGWVTLKALKPLAERVSDDLSEEDLKSFSSSASLNSEKQDKSWQFTTILHYVFRYLQFSLLGLVAVIIFPILTRETGSLEAGGLCDYALSPLSATFIGCIGNMILQFFFFGSHVISRACKRICSSEKCCCKCCCTSPDLDDQDFFSVSIQDTSPGRLYRILNAVVVPSYLGLWIYKLYHDFKFIYEYDDSSWGIYECYGLVLINSSNFRCAVFGIILATAYTTFSSDDIEQMHPVYARWTYLWFCLNLGTSVLYFILVLPPVITHIVPGLIIFFYFPLLFLICCLIPVLVPFYFGRSLIGSQPRSSVTAIPKQEYGTDPLWDSFELCCTDSRPVKGLRALCQLPCCSFIPIINEKCFTFMQYGIFVSTFAFALICVPLVLMLTIVLFLQCEYEFTLRFYQGATWGKAFEEVWNYRKFDTYFESLEGDFALILRAII